MFKHRVYDGGIFDPTPVEEAARNGANVIFCFLTQPSDKEIIDSTALFFLSLAPMKIGLKEAIRTMNERRQQSIQFIRDIQAQTSSIKIVMLYPKHMKIGSFEKDAGKVGQTYTSYFLQGKELLQGYISYPVQRNSSHSD